MQEKIILYGRPACAMLPSVRNILEQVNADYEYVDIYSDLHARERVREINQGYESVPTLIFPDGSTLTEPTRGELRAKLETLGYEAIPPKGGDWIQLIFANPVVRILGVLLIAIGMVGDVTWLALIGAAVLALGILANRLRRRN